MPRYSKRLKVVTRDMNLNLAKRVVRVTVAVHAELVKSTPVDTGWARANWIPGLQPAPPISANSGKGASVGAATVQAQHGLVQVLTGYKSIKQGIVWIVNSVPYISILNERHRTAREFIPKSIDRALIKVGLKREKGRRR